MTSYLQPKHSFSIRAITVEAHLVYLVTLFTVIARSQCLKCIIIHFKRFLNGLSIKSVFRYTFELCEANLSSKVYVSTLWEMIMSSPLNQQSLGLLIKERRKQASLTQDVAAMLCGVTKKTLIRVEKGEDVYISTVFKIINGLGINIISEQTSALDANGWY